MDADQGVIAHHLCRRDQAPRACADYLGIGRGASTEPHACTGERPVPMPFPPRATATTASCISGTVALMTLVSVVRKYRKGGRSKWVRVWVQLRFLFKAKIVWTVDFHQMAEITRPISGPAGVHADRHFRGPSPGCKALAHALDGAWCLAG